MRRALAHDLVPGYAGGYSISAAEQLRDCPMRVYSLEAPSLHKKPLHVVLSKEVEKSLQARRA